LFHQAPTIQVPSIGTLAYYPNRNSLSYIETYSLNGVENFVRTTLRHPAFCNGWDAIVQLGLTIETPIILKENETVSSWFKQHLLNHDLEALYAQLLEDETLKTQFSFIDLEAEIIIPSSIVPTNANILQWILEQKWKLEPADKDMVVMMHEIEYNLNNENHTIQSSLVLKGQDAVHTAMAATVGLPLAMGVCAYLKGEITLTGVQIPIHPSIYHPILKSLATEGIHFFENSFKH
jgi:saccharopine dehydrogenase-like NADP-dependent oxidoreductase